MNYVEALRVAIEKGNHITRTYWTTDAHRQSYDRPPHAVEYVVALTGDAFGLVKETCAQHTPTCVTMLAVRADGVGLTLGLPALFKVVRSTSYVSIRSYEPCFDDQLADDWEIR